MWLAFTAVVAAVVVADCIKIFTSKGAWRPLSLGGMPSTHAAIVAALSTAVFFETGLSLLFLVTAVFSLLVIRDAFGVRWEVTRHSDVLNKLTKSKEYKVAGHTRAQVFVGIVVGVVVTVLTYLLFAYV